MPGGPSVPLTAEVAVEVEKRIRRGHPYTKICRQIRKKFGWKLRPQDISMWKREGTTFELDGVEVNIKDFLDDAFEEASRRSLARLDRLARWAASEPSDADPWRPDPRLHQSCLNVLMYTHGQRNPKPNRLELSGSVKGGEITLLPLSELFGENTGEDPGEDPPEG